MIFIVVFIIGLLMLLDFGIATIVSNIVGSDGFEFVNPIWLYKRFTVNYFGAGLLTILFNILFLPFACCYWLYKLCTTGRR